MRLLVLLLVACHASPRPARFEAGTVHRAIRTTSAEAQQHFDRGLAYAYGFNFDEAQYEFLSALHEDPSCAMCMWGLAYVGGPNINEREKRWTGIAEAADRAVMLAQDPIEKTLAEALVRRYRSGDDAYAQAMQPIVRAHPDDVDVVILYTEAAMLTHPIGASLWPRAGAPANIAEARQRLEQVLAGHRDHIGAIHFYIHLMEDSPEWALAMPQAEKLAALAPGAGHLIHMASHLYLKAGRYADAEDMNKRAIAADEAVVQRMLPGSTYAGFMRHPQHFLWHTQLWLGERAAAEATAHALHGHVHGGKPDDMGFAEMRTAFMAIRFGDWDVALAMPVTDKPLGAFATHYARALAFVANKQLDDARKELDQVSVDASPDVWKPRMRPVAEAARAQLAGAIALAAGENDKAISELQRAVDLEDKMDNPMEPPLWVFPARQRLGAVLLAIGKAREAADVYRQDLVRNPHNGWSLFGLATALDALHDASAADTWKQFKAAWSRSDIKLTSSVL